MHWKPVYRYVHKVHHQSTNPTPWAAFSFHPFEAIIEALVIPITFLVMPIHPIVIIGFATFSNVINVLGHLGYEYFPKGFTQGKFWWVNTPTHHNMHHERFNYNYGFYFNFWDRIMGTNHKRYEEMFDRIKRN